MTSYYDDQYPNPCSGISVPKSDPRDSDYFRGYRGHLPHPFSASTGSEGRCDLCSRRSEDRNHRPPWTRLTVEELRVENERNLQRVIPLERPADHSIHDLSYAARQRRLDKLTMRHYAATLPPDFSNIIPPKEVPTTMRIAFTVEVPDLMAYARLVNLIQNEGNAEVITANMAPTPEPKVAQTATRRRIAVTPTEIRQLIDRAFAQEQTPEVDIDYSSMGDLTPTTRRILPIRWERNGNLGAIDVRSGGYKQYIVASDRMKRAEIV